MRTLSLSWSGARQGLITSGLNHVLHAEAKLYKNDAKHEAKIIRKANIKALVALGYDKEQAKKDIILYEADSPEYTKHSKLLNAEKYTKNWEKALNSEDMTMTAKYTDVPNSSHKIKWYPNKSGVKNASSLGLIRANTVAHVFEAGLEMIERMPFVKDDTVSDMHYDNAYRYLNPLPRSTNKRWPTVNYGIVPHSN